MFRKFQSFSKTNEATGYSQIAGAEKGIAEASPAASSDDVSGTRGLFEKASRSDSRAASLDSANAPLLSDEEPVEGDAPEEEKKELFDTAKYKLAFSHFLVNLFPRTVQTLLTAATEDIYIFHLERSAGASCRIACFDMYWRYASLDECRVW